MIDPATRVEDANEAQYEHYAEDEEEHRMRLEYEREKCNREAAEVTRREVPEEVAKDPMKIKLRRLAHGTWDERLELARELDCVPDRHGADRHETYYHAGDHETDARDTYPARHRLMVSIVEALAF